MMRENIGRRLPVYLWPFLVALILLLMAAPSSGLAAPEGLGFVGNMSPAGGSTSTITVGNSFTVYVQVYKAGVTEPAGQGATITCTLQWAPVGYFGGAWGGSTNTAMVFNTQIVNNDEYRATITPGVGLYEFTAFCTDTTDNSTTYQGGGNGRLKVDTASGNCNSASQANNDVFWNGLLHDSFATSYRNPIGPVTTAQGTVTLKFRTCMDDLNTQPAIRVWNDRTNSETISNLTFDSHASDATLGGVTTWTTNLSIPAQATALYYVFRAQDGTATAYYRDDNPKFYGGGYGQAEGTQSTAYDNSYQLTVYDPAFSVPSWMQRGVIYQIFPDRFRDGNSGNNPAAGRFSYNLPGGAIARSNQANWNYTVCDPRSTYSPSCADHYGDNFYGGDLQGVIDKINDGYFDNLGISVLYLNPIFLAPSNHKYDTSNYLEIDPDFGTLATFQSLVAAADSHGMKIMLDGVFNHTSSDSFYFDYYRRFDASGNVTSPSGIGSDDNSGACESSGSTYRNWFYISAAEPDSPTEMCDPADGDDPGGPWNLEYQAWYGYGSLPKLQANSTAVRNLIWNNGLSSVGPYWVNQGATGWRFDVGADVDPGLTNNPSNDYWEGFRQAVRAVDAETVTLGEEWGDATPWLLGNEWDSVMNYRFRSAVLSWLFTGCSGNGCSGGTVFDDNDSNSGSSSGSISYISPSQFNARLRSIQEDYPPMAFLAMMNLEGSHDTNRLRFLLKKVNNDNDAAAVQRMKEWWLFTFTYAGAPTLYYGDEIGLHHDGVWSSGKWEDDPYNRVPFPWPDAAGSSYGYGSGNDTGNNAATAGLYDFAQRMASIRNGYRALQDGEVHHGLIIDDTKQVYGFGRTYGTGSAAATQTALIALNRSNSNQSVSFTGLNSAPHYLPNGTVMVDALSGITYTVTSGAINLTVSSNWGVVLLEQGGADTPADVTGFELTGMLGPANAPEAPEADLVLSWDSVTEDTASGRETVTYYTVHASTNPSFVPGAGNLLATVEPSTFGSTSGRVSYTHINGAGSGNYYAVCAYNAAGVRSVNCAMLSPTAVTVQATTLKLTSSLWLWPVAAGLGLVVTFAAVWPWRRGRWLDDNASTRPLGLRKVKELKG